MGTKISSAVQVDFANFKMFFFQILKECFESHDIGKLQEAIKTLPESEARYHMKRCVDSGKPKTHLGSE
jgi:hypothetical protein